MYLILAARTRSNSLMENSMENVICGEKILDLASNPTALDIQRCKDILLGGVIPHVTAKTTRNVPAAIFIPQYCSKLRKCSFLDSTLSHPGDLPSTDGVEMCSGIKLANKEWIIVILELHNGEQAKVRADFLSFSKVVKILVNVSHVNPLLRHHHLDIGQKSLMINTLLEIIEEETIFPGLTPVAGVWIFNPESPKL